MIDWDYIRKKRDIRLSRCDWTQFSDSPLTDVQKSQWVTYRQALRDIPQTFSVAVSYDDIVWPIQPS